MIVCPDCHSRLIEDAPDVRCTGCGKKFRKSGPYLNLLLEGGPAFEAIPRPFFDNERQATARLFREYLWPRLKAEPFSTALDVGCGAGSIVTGLAEKGYQAFGVDLESLVPYWSECGYSPARFLVADAEQLPFPDRSLDVILSLGVVEHVGPRDGHSTLAADFTTQRIKYARSLVRVARPGARIILSCPNRHFPVDLQHGVEVTGARWRRRLFDRTHINLHRTWGDYHLLTYREIEELFVSRAGARSIEPLPLRGYFGFTLATRVNLIRLALPLLRLYTDNLPPRLRTTPLNPYVLVQVRA